jgi:DNA-binding LacI/PurR family transcriptional regulator
MASKSTSNRPTMRQVAALAGVSQQTVSRYLRHEGGLRDVTVVAIEAAIAELDYHPDLAARSMRTRRSDTLAVVLPGLLRGAVYQRELTAACAAAHDAGYRTEIVLSDGGPGPRSDHLRQLLASGRVDGALSLAPIEGTSDRRIVASADLDDDMRNIGALADGSTAGEIVEYLAGLGHRNFLHIAGEKAFASAQNRARAYSEAVERMGLVSHGIVGHSWAADAGYRAVVALPDDTAVTAVIASHDASAAGAVRAAFERGWGVPERLSVFGWGNQLTSQYLIPALSTVAVDREERGRHAMQQLIAAIRELPPPEARQTPLNTLIIRESTAAPGASAVTRPAGESATVVPETAEAGADV